MNFTINGSPSVSWKANVLNTPPKILPVNPIANNRIYESVSPSKPVAMLYVPHNPDPKFEKIPFPGEL